MLKWILIVIVLIGAVLYFNGALEFDSSDNKLNISIDKNKAEELGESVKDKIRK